MNIGVHVSFRILVLTRYIFRSGIPLIFFYVFIITLIQSWERELTNSCAQSVILSHHQNLHSALKKKKKLSLLYLMLRKDTKVKHFSFMTYDIL